LESLEVWHATMRGRDNGSVLPGLGAAASVGSATGSTAGVGGGVGGGGGEDGGADLINKPTAELVAMIRRLREERQQMHDRALAAERELALCKRDGGGSGDGASSVGSRGAGARGGAGAAGHGRRGKRAGGSGQPVDRQEASAAGSMDVEADPPGAAASVVAASAGGSGQRGRKRRRPNVSDADRDERDAAVASTADGDRV
jgi:hypothetical protein